MPELPEVEVTRRSFADRISGAVVRAVRMGRPLRWPLGVPAQQLTGCRVEGVRRRGKYLLLDLSEPRGLLLLHLGMSGSLSFSERLPPAGVHDHFELVTDRGTLRLHDPRRFGAVVFAENETAPQATQLLGRLGAEPLTDDWHFQTFHAGLRRRNTSIKQALLAGDLVVGVGNIYASEALFAAGIRPTTRASRIGAARAERLHGAIRTVLARAVSRGGSTLRDFSAADGQTGYFQLETMVYGRDGQPCRICNSPIRRLVQGQRATYCCMVCQR